MTTDIRIRVNGNYVAEGTVTFGDGTPNAIKVGPSPIDGPPIETSINVPHGSDVATLFKERPATEEEVAAANPVIEPPPAPDSSESSD